MNIVVLGSGNGGCAVAFDCAAHGHKLFWIRLRVRYAGREA